LTDVRWVPAYGFEDCYSVSDDGRMARTSTYGNNPRRVWKIIAPRKKRGGYITFHLCKNGVRTDPTVHRIMWESFVGPIPPKIEINHIDGVRDHNVMDNFELATRSENVRHGFRSNGRIHPLRGEKNNFAILTEEDIPLIRLLVEDGWPQRLIGVIFGVSQTSISQIALKKTWRHI
jgi:hypothetical protein